MTTFVGKWLYYPWLKGGHSIELIHPEDRTIEGLGVVECINEKDGYLLLKDKQKVVRAKIDGVKKELSTPAFKWNDSVQILTDSKKGTSAIIDNLFWHHLTSQYRYYVKVNNKRLSREYLETELQKHE